MADTLELLEMIGRTASLRRAPPRELVELLRHMEATEALKAAAASGDDAPLCEELGHKPMHSPQSTQTHGYEDDGSGQDQADLPPAPEPGQPSQPG
ncbi:hypothetical protein [Fulvimonas yonginensis]|uniref:Uncharacterized protein n=1 Tax=Fulvimonas yonginensis TaxID=1495200 RepID=A0ABU8JDA4_9GAMM